ncbi:penicillin-binding protein 2 [Candidatus Halobeggiatoa sp. HSG11]|nr:penicillin-binding protein 2 [Candidatus Halobeggiatoa sp. HSG11]
MPTVKNRRKPTAQTYWKRRQLLLAFFIIIISILLLRAVYLQVNRADFLQYEGNARHLRTVPIVAHRGMLMDRNGKPLAISTPVDSVWVNPSQFITAKKQWPILANLLSAKTSDLERILSKRMKREFVYLKRHVEPKIATQVTALKLPGVFLQREYKRYYPTGEVSAHVLGFTNIDDYGQEGLELALNNFLIGTPGKKQIVQDKNGKIIAQPINLTLPQMGHDIRLTIDHRLQYLVYRELKQAVLNSKAQAGSAVILDVQTGEVLAMINHPTYNPNNRNKLQNYRNRVVTDIFEPGSTLKPFTIASALASGNYNPNTTINTNPGRLSLGKYTIRDSRNYGVIDVATVIKKSSNVGASKIALSLSANRLWKILSHSGFGYISGGGFPGEVAGRLSHFSEWYKVQQASISFGYGIGVSLLQLARAYAMLGNDGVLPPIRFLVEDDSQNALGNENSQVISPKIARQMLDILTEVVKSGGTGELAQINGYTVAGKTGTVRKSVIGGYSESDYLALFVGIVPVSNPRLVMAILVDEPRQDEYYGGKVAAPVFSKVMTESLRLLNILPDTVKSTGQTY